MVLHLVAYVSILGLGLPVIVEVLLSMTMGEGSLVVALFHRIHAILGRQRFIFGSAEMVVSSQIVALYLKANQILAHLIA